ncbi:PcfB family protein, partial [Dysosmobacter welbionis]
SEFETFEIINGLHFLCSCDNAGTTIGSAHQFKSRSFSGCLFYFIPQIAGPYCHEVISSAVHIWHSVNISKFCKWGQHSQSFTYDVCHAGRHTFQDFGGTTQTGS